MGMVVEYKGISFEVIGEYVKGEPAITDREPYHCSPGTADEIENAEIFLTLDRASENDLTDVLKPEVVEALYQGAIEKAIKGY